MIKNILIYGYGELAQNFAKVLKEQEYDITIVEPDTILFEKAIKDGYEKVFNYSFLDDDEMIEIGIKDKFDAFLVVSDIDKNNIFIVLSARNLNKDLLIISIARNNNDGKKMKMAGANKVINPYEVSGMKIFRLIQKPIISKILDNIIENQDTLNIAETTIEENSYADGKYINELDHFLRKYNIIILGILENNHFILNDKNNHKLKTNDSIIIIGKPQDIISFKFFITSFNEDNKWLVKDKTIIDKIL